MATIKNKLKSSKDVLAEGLSNAATAANNAGGLAAKEARAAMMEGGQGRLAAALQGAQARVDASTNAFNQGMDKATSLAESQNQAEQQAAQAQASLDAEKEQMENANKEKKKDRIASIVGGGISALASAFSDEGCKKFAKRNVFK